MVQSHFDHVGLLLRFGDAINDLYILEAVGEYGVRLTSWLCARQFVGSFFEKIAFRKLFVQMTQEKMMALDAFRRNTCGKEYALNLKKIFTAKSEALSLSKQANISADRQFFCSELVAKAFKVLGVLKDL